MRPLRAFLLGALAVGLLGYGAAAGVAVAAQAGAVRAMRVAIGPLVLVAVERAGATRATTFGAGILVLALAGGVVNAAAAALLDRRTRSRLDVS